MSAPDPRVAATLTALADALAADDGAWWDAPSLCEGWSTRHVVAHVTMPARLTPEQYGAGMAAARGDFTAFSDAVAARDAALPAEQLLADLRSPVLHAWEPPGGGAAGALSHAVIHALDATLPLNRRDVTSPEAVTVVLDGLTAVEGAYFGIDLTGTRLEAADADWSWGTGELVRADLQELVALLSGRALPDGRRLPTR